MRKEFREKNFVIYQKSTHPILNSKNKHERRNKMKISSLTKPPINLVTPAIIIYFLLATLTLINGCSDSNPHLYRVCWTIFPQA